MALLIGTKTLSAVLRSYRPNCRTYPDSAQSNIVCYVDLDIGEDIVDGDGNIVKGPMGEESFKVYTTKVFAVSTWDFQAFLMDKVTNTKYQMTSDVFISEDTPAPEGIDPIAWALYVADRNASMPWYLLSQWAIDTGRWVL